MLNEHVMLNEYCLLSLSTKDCANYCSSNFAYWCEIEELQLLLPELGCVLLSELGCVDWQRYTFCIMNTSRHCICDR